MKKYQKPTLKKKRIISSFRKGDEHIFSESLLVGRCCGDYCCPVDSSCVDYWCS